MRPRSDLDLEHSTALCFLFVHCCLSWSFFFHPTLVLASPSQPQPPRAASQQGSRLGLHRVSASTRRSASSRKPAVSGAPRSGPSVPVRTPLVGSGRVVSCRACASRLAVAAAWRCRFVALRCAACRFGERRTDRQRQRQRQRDNQRPHTASRIHTHTSLCDMGCATATALTPPLRADNESDARRGRTRTRTRNHQRHSGHE
jgi:hypothetical protein